MVAITFFTFKQQISSFQNNITDLSNIDCFGSEYDGYMDLYNKLQTYKWVKSCSLCNCIKTGESCSFSLRFVL